MYAIQLNIPNFPELFAAHQDKLIGDPTSGKFSYMGVSGTYVHADNKVFITITDKPFLLPYKKIEQLIREELK